MKILVLHTGYGCDTGCCGHAIEVEDLAPGRLGLAGSGSASITRTARTLVSSHRN